MLAGAMCGAPILEIGTGAEGVAAWRAHPAQVAVTAAESGSARAKMASAPLKVSSGATAITGDWVEALAHGASA